jgi:hypothetical protein
MIISSSPYASSPAMNLRLSLPEKEKPLMGAEQLAKVETTLPSTEGAT